MTASPAARRRRFTAIDEAFGRSERLDREPSRLISSAHGLDREGWGPIAAGAGRVTPGAALAEG